jgi:hypothetical protein
MTFNFAEIADEVASSQANANEAQKGGGEYVPPPEGLARLRFIGYIEVGKHKKAGPNGEKIEDQVHLIFELSGKGYEPKELEDGTKIPYRMTVKLNKSLNEKANYYKLFKRMNYEQKATSFVQLLGKGFLGNVRHFELPAKPGEEKKVIANFRDDQGNLTIRPPRIETMDEETGELVSKPVPIPPAISDQRCFVWNGKPEWYDVMWPSTYIETEEKDGGYQRKLILSAINFPGSPIEAYLKSKGVDLGIPDAEDAKAGKGKPAKTSKPQPESDDDLLNGIVG